MRECWLQCDVSRGQFAEEFVIELRDFQNKLYSLFVSAECVDLDQDLDVVDSCQGRLRVELLELKGNLALVRLPTTPLENGPTVTVNASHIQQHRAAEPA